jgi:hypothetical protein
MFREDFWEEEEKHIREEEERAKKEGRRPGVQPTDSNRPGSGRVKTASGTGTTKKKKKSSVSGSISSVKTSSTGTGSAKDKSGKKKKKRTAEQAVAGLWDENIDIVIPYCTCQSWLFGSAELVLNWFVGWNIDGIW